MMRRLVISFRTRSEESSNFPMRMSTSTSWSINGAAKFDIMERVLALCAQGLAILFISSEISEVVRVSHRIAVLRDRRKVAELRGGDASEEQVYQLIAGGRS